MLNNIKTKFSITDLENITGIKSHTIRIWERRYSIFNPERNVNKVREYSSEDLKKLLNIDFLINKGYKISKIAEHKDDQIFSLVNKYVSQKDSSLLFLNQLKFSMLNFDSKLFNKTYNQLSKNYNFSEILYKVFFPFFEHIGLLWQTNSINSSHEHFISQLIRQRIHIEIEKNSNEVNQNETYVLFLPYNEIHDISLLCLYYELTIKNKNVIYLGENTEINSLLELCQLKSGLKLISSITFSSNLEITNEYFMNLNLNILEKFNIELYLFGPLRNDIELKSKIHIINRIDEFVDNYLK